MWGFLVTSVLKGMICEHANPAKRHGINSKESAELPPPLIMIDILAGCHTEQEFLLILLAYSGWIVRCAQKAPKKVPLCFTKFEWIEPAEEYEPVIDATGRISFGSVKVRLRYHNLLHRRIVLSNLEQRRSRVRTPVRVYRS